MMLEPTLALQTAVRAALINSPAVTALVPAEHIRSGSTRPDELPCIILSGIVTENLGRVVGGQYAAQCLIQLHIWATEDGEDTAQQIGFAVFNALLDAPATDGFLIVDWQEHAVRWMRDPDQSKSLSHGIVSLQAVIQWRL